MGSSQSTHGRHRSQHGGRRDRLVKRTLDADGAGPNPATTQYWVYDEGINAVMQFDGAAATNLSHRYLWSDVVDELFADEQITSPSVPGNTLWGLADNLGTLRDIADFNESTLATTVTNHRTFNANGKLVAETNAVVDMLFAFTGKQLDDSTGLQHNLYRWYDAKLGQWLSEDPMGFAAGDENLRRYVVNNSTTKTDPNGLEPKLVGAIASSLAAGDIELALILIRGGLSTRTGLPLIAAINAKIYEKFPAVSLNCDKAARLVHETFISTGRFAEIVKIQGT